MNSLPAERERGCSFAESFINQEAITKNGGTLNGAPEIKNGLVLNGTTQNAVFNLAGSEFDSSNISIVIKFIPNFLPSVNSSKYLIDNTSGNRFLIYKRDNANNNVLTIYMGNAVVGNVALATYEPYWNVNRVNTLVVSGTSGNTNAWLNGALILNGSSAVWTKKTPTELYIGSSYVGIGGGALFNGNVLEVKVFKKILTGTEAVDISNNATFTYENKATIDLKMGLAQHDITNTRTLDVSGSGKHATLINTPTKLNQCGYSFNGSNQYLTVSGTGLFNKTNQTIAVEFTPSFSPADNIEGYLYDGLLSPGRYFAVKEANGLSNVIYIGMGGTLLTPIAQAAYEPYWRKNQINILVVSGTSGNTTTYLNGAVIGTSSTAWTPSDLTTLLIGVRYNNTKYWNSKIHRFRVWDTILNETQIIDMVLTAQKEVNCI